MLFIFLLLNYYIILDIYMIKKVKICIKALIKGSYYNWLNVLYSIWSIIWDLIYWGNLSQ